MPVSKYKVNEHLNLAQLPSRAKIKVDDATADTSTPWAFNWRETEITLDIIQVGLRRIQRLSI
jgi:hypothetical protein